MGWRQASRSAWPPWRARCRRVRDSPERCFPTGSVLRRYAAHKRRKTAFRFQHVKERSVNFSELTVCPDKDIQPCPGWSGENYGGFVICRGKNKRPGLIDYYGFIRFSIPIKVIHIHRDCIQRDCKRELVGFAFCKYIRSQIHLFGERRRYSRSSTGRRK